MLYATGFSGHGFLQGPAVGELVRDVYSGGRRSSTRRPSAPRASGRGRRASRSSTSSSEENHAQTSRARSCGPASRSASPRLYGTEVPAYDTLVDVSREVNSDFVARHGADAARLGSIERVTAERHGAIRVGLGPRARPGGARVRRVRDASGGLLRPAGRLDELGARGVHGVPADGPGGAGPQPVPGVHLDAGRRRPALLRRRDRRRASRRSWPRARCSRPSCSRSPTARPSRTASERRTPSASSSSRRARSRCRREPVDHDWYFHLERISSVAADIGGVPSTHINHLTPRVLDIDDLYARMQARGIAMIDEIQGPPRWEGPDVLLRQTSFRALAEERLFRASRRDGRRRLAAGPLRRGRAARHRADRHGSRPVRPAGRGGRPAARRAPAGRPAGEVAERRLARGAAGHRAGARTRGLGVLHVPGRSTRPPPGGETTLRAARRVGRRWSRSPSCTRTSCPGRRPASSSRT